MHRTSYATKGVALSGNDFLLFPSVKLFDRAEIPQKETIISSGACTHRRWYRYALPAWFLCVAVAECSRITFGNPTQLTRKPEEAALIQAFKHFLRIDWPVFNRCWHGNLFHFSLQCISLNFRYYNQDLYKGMLHEGSRQSLRSKPLTLLLTQ